MKTMFLASLLVLSSFAHAGQFGLEMGESLASIRAKVNLTQSGTNVYVYSTPKLPDGHPAFDDYRLFITPAHGLCRIQAWTPIFQSDAYGDAVKAKFSNLFDALESKYGANLKKDSLKAGSIWDEPRDWMTGLVKNERFLGAYWGPEERSKMPDDVSAISISAAGVDSDAAMILLTYEFANFAECGDWVKAQENSSL